MAPLFTLPPSCILRSPTGDKTWYLCQGKFATIYISPSTWGNQRGDLLLFTSKPASPPRFRIIRLPTPPKNPPATEAVPPQAPPQTTPQAPPQAPTPPCAPTPPVAEPSLNDNFEPERSPPTRNEPAASKDYSSAKSDDESDDSDEEDSDSDASEEPEANVAAAEAEANDDNDLAIINPSQERAIVVTRETGLPHISPPP